MRALLTKAFKENSDTIILTLNVLFSKAFSFLLFWILGVKLLKEEFSEFIIEMPFIFLFSTVLSFGIATFFMDQKKLKVGFGKSLRFSLSLVFVLNVLLSLMCLGLFLVKLISLNTLLLFVVTVSFNVNYILMEFYFSLKSYLKMALVNILPKLFFLIIIFFFLEESSFTKNTVYVLLILLNLAFSIPILKFLDVKFPIKNILAYFKFTWILTIQPFLAYITYVSSRYFIKMIGNTDYLIEFSVLQTYMGIFALLVSISNRLIIHDLYEALIANNFNIKLKKKFIFINKVFFLFGFLYFHVVLFYLKYKMELQIDYSVFLGILIMIIASLIYFVAQYAKTIITFYKKFSYMLRVNVISTILTVVFSYVCMVLKINLLFPLSIFLVNTFIYFFYLAKVENNIWNNLFDNTFVYKMLLSFLVLLSIEYIAFNKQSLFIILNIIALVGIIYDLISQYQIIKRKS